MLQKIINNRFFLVFLIPLLLGLMSAFSFQPYNYTILNFLIFPILFFILCYVNKKSKNRYRKKPYLVNLFFIGYLFGIGFFLSGTYWISYSLTFDDNFKFLIPISIILIPSMLGIFFGLSTLICGPFLKKNFPSIIFFIISFAFLDYLRSKIFTGFPWNIWAYSWSSFTEFIQILNVIGVFAFNVISITIFCTPILLFLKKNKINSILLISIIIISFSNYIFGSITINQNKIAYEKIKISSEKKINIKIISPNFDLKYNLEEKDIPKLLNKLTRYSAPDKNKDTLFIWPEGVFTGYNYSDISKYKNIIKSKFAANHKILLGINTYDKNLDKHYNSLIILNRNFEIIYRYDKKKLVPFGEFLPFENILNRIGLKKITHGHGSFAKGEKTKNYITDGFNILPLICYEIIFPEMVQKSDIETNIIINISEDAWFGNTIGPHQHFAKAIFRAIESNSFVIRSANKGFSAFINNKGHILKQLNPTESGSIEMNVPLLNNSFKNRNDLIFFLLLFTYTIIFFTIKKNYND